MATEVNSSRLSVGSFDHLHNFHTDDETLKNGITNRSSHHSLVAGSMSYEHYNVAEQAEHDDTPSETGSSISQPSTVSSRAEQHQHDSTNDQNGYELDEDEVDDQRRLDALMNRALAYAESDEEAEDDRKADQKDISTKSETPLPDVAEGEQTPEPGAVEAESLGSLQVDTSLQETTEESLKLEKASPPQSQDGSSGDVMPLSPSQSSPSGSKGSLGSRIAVFEPKSPETTSSPIESHARRRLRSGSTVQKPAWLVDQAQPQPDAKISQIKEEDAQAEKEEQTDTLASSPNLQQATSESLEIALPENVPLESQPTNSIMASMSRTTTKPQMRARRGRSGTVSQANLAAATHVTMLPQMTPEQPEHGEEEQVLSTNKALPIIPTEKPRLDTINEGKAATFNDLRQSFRQSMQQQPPQSTSLNDRASVIARRRVSIRNSIVSQIAQPQSKGKSQHAASASVSSVASIASSLGGVDPSYDMLLARLEAQNQELSRSDSRTLMMAEQNREELKDGFQRLYENSKAEVSEDQGNVDWGFWSSVVSDFSYVAKSQPKLLTKHLQAGVPPELRGLLWQLFSRSKESPELEFLYTELLKEDTPFKGMILRDVGRTFPHVEYFKEPEGRGQTAMANLLKAYALLDNEVGYCQGLAFIAGVLLLNLPEEDAFAVFVRLMTDYDMREHYTPGMDGLQLRLYQLDRLIEDQLPHIHRHFAFMGIRTSMFASQWFMTVFAYRLELPLVFRIFDIMLVEGIDVMLRSAFAIIKRSEAIILGMGFDEVLQYLKRGILDEYNEDHRKLVQDIYSVKLSSRKLNAYTTEHERHVAKAIQESLELNNLQVLQKQMTEHVRHLETKLASLNREHVELANELVSTRVEVTNRQEQNELYRQELSELSKALDVIPLEIERRSREKLDALMEENNKLANDNATLEDKLASLEMTVIDLKMRFAESENDKEMVQRRLREMKKYMAVHT